MEIAIEVGTATGVIRLWDLAPRAVAALQAELPITSRIQHCRWSGDACFADLGGTLDDLDTSEATVVSIYPGTLALRAAEDPAPTAEILLAYGAAEHRWPTGPKPVTPLGEMISGTDAVFEVLRGTATGGPQVLRLTERSS